MKEKKRNCIYAKKALVPMLALVLILTATLLPIGVGPPGIFAYATDAAKISLVKVSEDTLNDTVVLKVNLDTVPTGGISLVEFKVKYPEEFEITKSEVLELMGTGEDQYVIKGQTTANPYYVAQASLVQDEDGVYKGTGGGIIRLTFALKDTATLTDDTGYTFTLQDVKAYRLDADATSSSIDGTPIDIADDGVTTYTYTPVKDNHSGTVDSSSVTVTQPEAASGETTPVVKTQTVREAITKADKSSEKTITLNAASSSSIALTKTAAAAIATQKDGETGETSASGKSLDIQMSTSELKFDSTAVASIGDKSGGEKLVIETERTEDSTIVTGDAVDALKYEVTAKLVDVSTNESTPVTSFGGGEVTVSLDLPNTWTEADKTDLICWNYTDTNYTVVNGHVDGNKYVFTTKHFSHYIVAKQATLTAFNTDSTSKTIRTEGVTVSGTITSWNNINDYVIKFYDAGEDGLADDQIRSNMRSGSYDDALSLEATTAASPTESGKQWTTSFSVTGVGTGSYKIAIYKPGKYVVKVVPFTVESSAVDLDELKMWLYGDVNYDGKVNSTGDVLNINRYIANLSSIFDQGDEQTKKDRFAAANVTAIVGTDTVINSTGDVLNINRYIANLSSALDRAKIGRAHV